jgi:hypothetical protein
VDGEEADAGRVDAGDDQVGTNVTLVSEQMLLQHRHHRHDAGLAAGGESVQLEVGGDEGGRELGVGGCAGAGAEDRRGDIV